jgi:TonB-linked SusC/RagA family outer membrane protein
MRQRAGVNITGGSDKFRYFSNLNFINQEQPLIAAGEPGRKYDPTPHVNIVNFRSNMDISFNRYLSGFMRLTGNVKWERRAGDFNNWTIYRQIFSMPPTMYGPLSPQMENKAELSNQVVTEDGIDPPVYGLINRSGYTDESEINVIAQTGLKIDLGFLTQGLSLSGAMAYQTYSRNTASAKQEFQRVIQGSDRDRPDNFTLYRSYENTPLSLEREAAFFYYLNLYANMEYRRRFGEHSVDVSAHTYFLTHEKDAAGWGDDAADVLPYKRQNSGLSLLYGYKNRYFLKGDLGYSGSEQFHPDHRYVATPAVSAAWIASKENFFNIDAVNLLKFRASYGITASDELGDKRFLYLDNIRWNGEEGLIGNPELEAEKIKKTNLGLDLAFFNCLTAGFDYFAHTIDNMLVEAAATIPQYQGIPLENYPKLNNGKMENKGFEISIGINKQLSKDWTLFAQMNWAQAKNKVISINQAPLGEDYVYPYRTEGFSVGRIFGYLIDYSNGNGMYNTADELANSALRYSFGTPRVGDFIYRDLNNDGLIDEKDKVPMGYSYFPEQEYSLTGGFSWKNWEFSFLLHGVNHSSQMLSGIGAYENMAKGIFSDMHQNAWTPERYARGETIAYPALSLSPSTNHEASEFYLSNRSFLRLRNVEIAYTLPGNIAKKVSAERIRIALNVQNLFTIDRMLSKYLDPETIEMGVFQPYRVFNLGVSATF